MKNKCSNCDSKNLVKTYIFCPTDDGFVDFQKTYIIDSDFHNIDCYLCENCGYIELYAIKKEDCKRN